MRSKRLTGLTRNSLPFGQILIELGWIEARELDLSLRLASESGQPLGRLLMERGLLSGFELQNLIEAQALLRDGILEIASLRPSMEFASWCGISLENALLFLNPGFAEVVPDDRRRLGQILIQAGYIEPPALVDALAACRTTGLQVGRILVLRKQLEESVLNAALQAQSLLHQEVVDLEQVLSSLRVLRLGLHSQVIDTNAVLPLGELVMHAGLVSERHIEDALEVSSLNGQPLGQVLLIFALLSDRLLNAALELQCRVKAGQLTASMAVRALSQIFSRNCTINEALACIESHSEVSLSVSTFLQLTGLFGGCLREIRHIELTTGFSREQLPQLASMVDGDSLRAATRCTYLIRQSVLTLEQGLLAFHYSFLSGADIDIFLLRAGWASPRALKGIARSPVCQQSGRSFVPAA